MGRGSSKIGGASGGGARSEEQAFVDEMVAAMSRSYNPDEIPMSHGDMESAAEAFAMTHPGVDENALISRIDSEVSKRSKSASATKLSAPADINSYVSPTHLQSLMKEKGFTRVTDTESLEVGTPVVLSTAIMKSSHASQSDPDGVHFQTGTYAGRSTSAFNWHLIKLPDGKTKAVHSEYKFENLYRKG